VPPADSVVISTAEDCAVSCRLLARSTNYIVYAVWPTELAARPARLGAVGARLSSRELPASIAAGQSWSFEVIVRNVGGETWPAVGDAGRLYRVNLYARWLRPDGSIVREGHWFKESATPIPYDMEPGDTAGIRMEVSAPSEPGEYVLELDVIQEGAEHTGARGSQTLRARVEVLPPG
jgi:hypothetical protein